MNVIPLFKDVEDPKERIKTIAITIPAEWWESSYSFNYKQKNNAPIFEYKKTQKPKFPSTPGWDIAKGDYRVHVSKLNSHDYVYYRDLKIKLLKYSIYPVTIFTILLILKLSEILSNI